MRYLILLTSFSFCFCACYKNKKASTTKILTINTSVDSCYVLLDSTGRPVSAYRKMKILENSLSDSILIGFAVIPPGRLGEMGYYRVDTSVDKCFDPKYGTEDLPKTPMICLNLYLKRNFKGEIKIEYEY